MGSCVWSNYGMVRFLTFRHILFYVLSCMKPSRSLAIYRIKRHLYSWVGCDCTQLFEFREEPFLTEGTNCEYDSCVKKTGCASCFTSEPLWMCWRDLVWIGVTARRLVGGMPRATTSYRPTTQTQTYTYASLDTVLTCHPKVIERFDTVWPWKGCLKVLQRTSYGATHTLRT